MSWKLVAFAPKAVVQSALAAHEEREDWDEEIILTGSEVAEHLPDDWQLDAYMPRRPLKADRLAVASLFADGAPELKAEKLPETDWVVETQKMVQPIRAGRFHVHTPDYPAEEAEGVIDFTIPASQAFGTGQHATTAGCLTMLDAMKRSGLVVRNCADIGTGTGLLAFGALALWPRAHAIASDIDKVCLPVVEGNAALNDIAMGSGAGQLTMVIAEGLDDDQLQTSAPYDLLMANILAGPLVSLAGEFGWAVAPGGSLLLAGLLETQEAAVRAAYRAAGFRLAARIVNGDWSILWLRKRATFA
ncbi:50S ribosomal protein L11 methyltransferase [Altererythrobacter xixiisoli]|uniref:Ribosomal protein L11 methyltransferase n=1 Tax=Croceibacterium xixiisoli TaxID=1476466 RepID=A0A6I4TSG2_9SPHN|nr:50S ribosomal protein L11 methyltransferase [Croceibacterium xixiisoli]MXO99075.1 50S ribosomal protein L11 methyltransferase [Croceibacterium xixiisoli]